MENYFPFHHLSEADNMMANIVAEGKETIWRWIEEQPDAFKRCTMRNFYTSALTKINKGK